MVGGRCPESAPGGARTRDLPLRRRLLYPTELRRLTHRNRWPRKNRKRARPGGTVRVRAHGPGPLSSIAGSVVTRRLLQGFADGHEGHHRHAGQSQHAGYGFDGEGEVDDDRKESGEHEAQQGHQRQSSGDREVVGTVHCSSPSSVGKMLTPNVSRVTVNSKRISLSSRCTSRSPSTNVRSCRRSLPCVPDGYRPCPPEIPGCRILRRPLSLL